MSMMSDAAHQADLQRARSICYDCPLGNKIEKDNCDSCPLLIFALYFCSKETFIKGDFSDLWW
jgi:hypothetical protein